MVARAWLHIVYLVVPDCVNLKVKTLSRLRSLSLSLQDDNPSTSHACAMHGD